MLTWGRCKNCPLHFTDEQCRISQRDNGCHACGKTDCWQMNPACPYFGRCREDHQDAELGDSIPHMRETHITCTADGFAIEGRHGIDWWKQYKDVCFSINEVNHFSMGKASGEECNCLIDTLRQQMNLKCDVRAVRNYLQTQHSNLAATEFLELQKHWMDIIAGLAHVLGKKIDASAYRIICVDAMFVGNGDVEGNGSHTLYIARQNADHFVPLLRRTIDNCAGANKKRSYVQAMCDDMEEEVWLPVLSTENSSTLSERWLNQVSPLLSKYDATILSRYIRALPTQSLQKVWNASRSDYLNYVAKNVCQDGQGSMVQEISKMAMRRVLETTFARLSLDDPDIDSVYEQWLATSDRPKRKSKASSERHTADWTRRQWLRGGKSWPSERR